MIAAVLFLAVFCIYLATLCPTVCAGDTVELILAGLNLDVTHPPGYPLQCMLVRLVTLLPAGGLVFRATLLPACAGAGVCVLVYQAARNLKAHGSSALLAAGLLAVMPFLWWQSTMLEKYSLQMCCAALVLAVATAPGSRLLATGFVFSLALAFHPLALMLIPLPVLVLWRERSGARWARLIALVLVLGILPQTVRIVYTAIRSDTLNRDSLKGGEAINWGEPYNATALWNYLLARYYAGRFDAHSLSGSGFSDHLRNYPRQLTWPGLTAGLAGLALLLLYKNRPVGTALAAVAVLSFWFSMRMVLPPALSAQNHQNGFLVIVLAAAAAFEAVRSRTIRFRGIWPVLAVAVAASLAALAWTRHQGLDAGRNFIAHDYLAGLLRVAPPGAVVMGAVEGDALAPRCFKEVNGIRPDVVCLPFPSRAMSGCFLIRRHYRAWAVSLLPGAALNFTDADPPGDILRRIVGDNAGRTCWAVSGLSEPFVPRDLFTIRGNLFLARGATCGQPGPEGPAGAWRALSSRSWFSPDRLVGTQRTVIENLARCLSETAGLLPANEAQAILLRVRTRLLPDQPTGWAALAENCAARGLLEEGLAHYRRAAVLAPGSPMVVFGLLRMALRAGKEKDAGDYLRAVLSRPPFSLTGEGRAALAGLDRGKIREAFELAMRAFARVALEEADRLPMNPEMARKKVFLYSLAADLAPRWALAQERRAAMLLSMGQIDEAKPYLDRLRELDPGNVVLHLKLAEMLSATGRREEARRIRADAARRAPGRGR